jgi:hypothetical protein
MGKTITASGTGKLVSGGLPTGKLTPLTTSFKHSSNPQLAKYVLVGLELPHWRTPHASTARGRAPALPPAPRSGNRTAEFPSALLRIFEGGSSTDFSRLGGRLALAAVREKQGALKNPSKLSADLFAYHNEKYDGQSYEAIAARCSNAFNHYISSDADGSTRSSFLIHVLAAATGKLVHVIEASVARGLSAWVRDHPTRDGDGAASAASMSLDVRVAATTRIARLRITQSDLLLCQGGTPISTASTRTATHWMRGAW